VNEKREQQVAGPDGTQPPATTVIKTNRDGEVVELEVVTIKGRIILAFRAPLVLVRLPPVEDNRSVWWLARVC